MSSTNKTTYYELPQYVDSDIFNPLADDNDAYSKIDTALYDIASVVGGNVTEIANVKGRMTTAESDINTLEAKIGNTPLTTVAQTLSGAVNELERDIDSVNAVVDILSDDVNNATTGLKVKVTALETQNGSDALTTTAQTLSGAVNELDEDIITLNGAINDLDKDIIELKYYKTPEMFGAVGDGVTDDTQSLNDCFTGGGYIYLSKNYKITDKIVVPSNTTVKASKASKVTMVSSAKVEIFDCADTNHVTFDGLTIVGSQHYDGASDAYIHPNEFGISFGGVCSDIVIKNCNITKCGQGGVLIFNTNRVLIDNCYISYLENESGSFEPTANYNFGIRVYRETHNLVITNCEIMDVAIGIYLPHTGSDVLVDNCHIHHISAQHAFYCAIANCTLSNNHIHNIYSAAFDMQYDSDSKISYFTRIINNEIDTVGNAVSFKNIYNSTIAFYNAVVSGNYIKNALNGILLTHTANIVVSDNNITEARQYGILLTGHNDNVTIHDNIIYNCGQDERDQYDFAINVIDNSGVVIKDNTIISTDNKMSIGIMLASSSAQNVEIFDNIIKGATSYAIRAIEIASLIYYSNNNIDKGTLPIALTTKGITADRFTLDAVPVSGDYRKGDIVYNSAPEAGGNIGWVCVTAGNPGTWKAFGTIEA